MFACKKPIINLALRLRTALRRSLTLVPLLALLGTACSSSEENGNSPDAAAEDASKDASTTPTDANDGSAPSSCPYDCFGGACVDHVCQPVQLHELTPDFNSNSAGSDLALAGEKLYWTNGGKVYGSRVDGSNKVVVSNAGGATYVGASATKVYFNEAKGSAGGSGQTTPDLYEVPATSGESGTPDVRAKLALTFSPAAQEIYVGGLSVVKDVLYMTLFNASGSQYFTLFGAPVGGAAPYAVSTFVRAYLVKESTVAPDGMVYVIDRNGGVNRVTPTVDGDSDFTDKSKLIVKGSGPYRTALHANDKYLYWLDAGSLKRANRDGSDMTDISERIAGHTPTMQMADIVIDEECLFFSDGHHIYRWAAPR